MSLSALLLGVRLRLGVVPLLLAATVVGTAGWFFFYAIFALRIRRNDAFNTVTSIFYFVFLFASSMFYPLEPLPRGFQVVALCQPDHLARRRAALRDDWRRSGRAIAIESAAFVVFTLVAFAAAVQALEREG